MRRRSRTPTGGGEKWRGAGLWPLLLPAVGFYLPALIALARGWSFTAGNERLLSGWSDVLLSTAVLAGGGALVAGLWGGFEGFLLEAFPGPLRRVFFAALLVPFLLPTAVLTAGAQTLLGRGPVSVGLFGGVLISGVQMAPLVMLGVARAIRSIPEEERRALLFLPPRRAAWGVVLPRTLPVVAAMTLVVFLLLIPKAEVASYVGVPAALGVRVLAAFTMSGNRTEGWLWIFACGVVIIPLLWGAARALRSVDPRPTGFGTHPRLRSATLWPTVFLATVTVGGCVPLVRLAVDAGLPPWAGARTWLGGQGPWAGGLLWEVARCLWVGGGLAVLGWRLAQHPSRVAWVLFALPLFLPESLPAVALQEVEPWLPPFLGATPILLSVAQAIRFGGVALILGHLVIEGLPGPERQAAQLLPPRRRRWRVMLPRSLPALAVSTVVIALLQLGEVECAMLLVPPGYAVPALDLSQFLHYRYDADAARLAFSLAAVGLLAVGGIWVRRGTR